ncbi:hypothetical protein FJZ31_31985 [Candidatus Poribacteria bacterium]|nr:hypothetical protein [Candidatus Poribacteria bacterium]
MNPGRILKVVIREAGQEEPKVEVSLPLKLAKWALRLLPVVKTKLEGHTDVDLNALAELLNEGFTELEELGEFELVRVREKDSDIRISIELPE